MLASVLVPILKLLQYFLIAVANFTKHFRHVLLIKITFIIIIIQNQQTSPIHFYIEDIGKRIVLSFNIDILSAVQISAFPPLSSLVLASFLNPLVADALKH